MILNKINLPNKHVFKGIEFPIAFTPDKVASVEETEEFLKSEAKKGVFNELLKKNGAVVIRGLGAKDPETFTKYIKAIGYESGDIPFVQNGSTAQRTEITDILSTANEGPPDRIIYQHNEFSRFAKYPTKLFFVCSKMNAEGGETPIVHGGEFFEEVKNKAPEYIKRLSKDGLYMEQVWKENTKNNTHWSYKFCFGRDINEEIQSLEEKKKIALKLAKEYASEDSQYIENNDLLVRQHTKPIRLYKVDEKEEFPCFYNSIACFYGDVKEKIGGYANTKNICYDDGTEIPVDYLDITLLASIEKAYNHVWVEGDLVIVNNYLVSHGRLPWKGERKVMVSMWDTPAKGEFQEWVSQE